ncbi:hypothetical protein BJY24_005302 [Nocardia transvalensis]|uniref:HD domain-containing protein n=1 Tax=Nocardia transvalensis TaxID=37333 RepID=A0A7W9PI98_9NOCA|nr:hypothetical protein [Nocardia transvalensis]MBB5916390.1 hypothetical protein [Nocardia transvalensis]
MQVRTSHPIVDAVLDRYRRELGEAFPVYRNHVLRGLNYHEVLLGEPVPDTAALAWAVHDLGIWTAGTWDYLAPSADLVGKHAEEFGIEDTERARRMVLDHHRLRGIDDRLPETFRIADRVDASHGLLRGPVPRADIETVVAELPYLGFHRFLLRTGTRWALRHPFHPLPMVRW